MDIRITRQMFVDTHHVRLMVHMFGTIQQTQILKLKS
jgi:hypothetical protein